MKASTALILAGLLAAPHTALAKGQDEARSLAVCAWQKVPQTAAALARVKPEKRMIYDEVSSTRAAPFMRVYAACDAEKKALFAAAKTQGTDYERSEAVYQFLVSLKKAQPAIVPADGFTTRVFRCEARFVDLPAQSAPAKVWWGFGADPFAGSSLGSKAEVFNNQFAVTAADIAAIEKRGDGVRNLHDLLMRGQSQQMGEFETHAAGMASGKAFLIKPTGNNSICRTVAPTGELTDAQS